MHIIKYEMSRTATPFVGMAISRPNGREASVKKIATVRTQKISNLQIWRPQAVAIINGRFASVRTGIARPYEIKGDFAINLACFPLDIYFS